jgi:hypothetical protein
VQVNGVVYVAIASPEAASALHVAHRRDEVSPLVKAFTALMLKG